MSSFGSWSWQVVDETQQNSKTSSYLRHFLKDIYQTEEHKIQSFSTNYKEARKNWDVVPDARIWSFIVSAQKSE